MIKVSFAFQDTDLIVVVAHVPDPEYDEEKDGRGRELLLRSLVKPSHLREL